MKKTLLLTGATGLVGSRFIEMFQDEYEIHNMDLTTGVDITNKQKIQDFVKNHPADTLIHLAAFTNVNKAHEQEGDKDGLCYQVNVKGTQNIAEVVLENNIHLIHISTDFVFSGKKQEPYTEKDEKNPIEWYGQTKAWAEDKVEEILNNYTITRIGFPFRAKNPEKKDIFHKTLSGLKDGSLYPQFTDMIITPTYIDDFSRALDVIIQEKPQGTYHLHGSTSLSPYEFAQEIAEIFGYDKEQIEKGSLEEFQKTTDRPYHQRLIMDNSKAKNELGIELKTTKQTLKDIKSQLA